MPFGFDPINAEKDIRQIREESKRVYIEVTIDWLPNGKMIPVSFVWDNGKEYRIDKIISMQKGHSLKVFAPGLRYYCQTGKRRYYLHYDGERWYVEKNSVSY